MSDLTKNKEPFFYQPLSCYAYRGDEKSIESSNYTLFNPTINPGCGVLAGSSAARASIGSQVACRLALEHFSQALLEYYAESKPAAEDNSEALETAFREANRSVYSFGHSLAAGGRMAAVFLAIIIRSGSFAAGRVGGGSAYLLREGELYSFFEQVPENQERSEDTFLGSRSLVAVDLANVPAEANDKVFVFSEELTTQEEADLKSIALDSKVISDSNPAEAVSRYLFSTPSSLGFCFAVFLGPDALFLPSNLVIKKE